MMARSKGFVDVDVVRAARDVFWQRGYVATSLAQLQLATGLNKSSLYETYGSKRGLFDRAISSYLDEVIGPLLAALEAPGAGRSALLNYFSVFAAVFRGPSESAATRGCFMLNTAVELNELDHAANEAVNRYRLRVQAAILNSVRGIVGDDHTARLRADVLTAAQIGMMITSRMDPHRAADLADQLAADITTWR